MKHFLHMSFLVMHLVALVFGLGGATLTDVLFVACVRARRAGRTLTVIIKTAANIVVVGYVALLVSGIGLLSTGSHVTSRVSAKLIIVLVIGVNGVVSHYLTFPQIKAKIHSTQKTVSLDFLHQLSIVAAISGASWYSTLVIATWKTTAIPFFIWISGYLIIVLSAVVTSLVFTPKILNVDLPGFEDVFPTLAPSAMRASAIVTRERPAQRQLPPPSLS